MNHSFFKNRQRGFTLLEVLIATAILAVLGVMATSGLSSVLKASGQSKKVGDEIINLQLAFNVIQRDMMQIINRPIRDEFGDVRPPLSLDASGEFLIEMTRWGWNNPLDQRRSDLQRVAYRIEAKKWVRTYWEHLDRGPEPKQFDNEMMEGVSSVEFRFLNGSGEWITAWPELNVEQPSVLPKAVAIRLDTVRWGSVERIFPVAEVAAPEEDNDEPQG